MASGKDITRRAAVVAGFGGAGWLIANANGLTVSPRVAKVLQTAGDGRKGPAGGLPHPKRWAGEYGPSDFAPYFKPNGAFIPVPADNNRHAAQHFANWRLKIDGLV